MFQVSPSTPVPSGVTPAVISGGTGISEFSLRRGDGATGRRGDGATGRRGDGATGRRGVLPRDSVVDEGGKWRLTNASMLEIERLGEPGEQQFSTAEDDRGDDDRQLIDEPVAESLAEGVGAAHDVAALPPGRRRGPVDSLGKTSYEDEVVTRRLLLGPMGHHEERD